MPRPIKYDILADPSGIKRGAQQAQDALQSLNRTAERVDRTLGDINVDIDVDADLSTLDILRRRLLAAKADLEREIRIDPDVDTLRAMTQLRTLERRLKGLDRMDVSPEVNVDVDRGISAFVAGGATAALKFGEAFSSAVSQPIESGLKVVATNPIIGTALAAGIAATMAGAISQALVTVGPIIATGVGGMVGGGFALGVGRLGLDLLEQYDTLDKSRRKASIVFGKELGQIKEWARELSTGIGLGAVELESIAAGVQDLMVPKGFTRGQASDITKLIVERGAAIAEFQGLDAQQGIDAVTSALLGQTRQLKTMGVEISAAKIKEQTALIKTRKYWIDYGEDGVKSADDVTRSIVGMNDEQLKTIAVLELMQEKSTDAWTAFKNGASTADDILDIFNATMANIRTDAIEGFGRILIGVIDDLGFAGEEFKNLDLGKWITENEAGIRSAMQNIILWALKGADAFLVMADSVLANLPQIAGLLGGLIRGMGGFADSVTRTAAGFRLLTDNAFSMSDWKTLVFGTDFESEADEVATNLENAINGIDVTGARDNIAGLRDGIAGFRTDIESLQAADKIAIPIETVLNEDGKAAAKDLIRDLSDEEIEILVTTGVLDDTELKNFLGKEYDKRINARVELEFNGRFATADEVSREVDRLFSQGRVTEAVALKKRLDATVTFKADTSKVDAALSGFSGAKSLDLNITTPNLGQTKTALDGLDNPRTAPFQTQLSPSYFGTKSSLDNLARPRTVLYTVRYQTVGRPPGATQQSVVPGEGYAQQSVAVTTEPQVSVYVQDERLTDLIDVEIGGRSQATARRFTRRYGVV